VSSGPADCHRAAAFGLHWQSDIPLHPFPPDPAPQIRADIKVRLTTDGAPGRDQTFRHGNVSFALNGFRFRSGEAATIDVYGHDRVDVHPGPEWPGLPPLPLFGTVTAMICARRGLLPMHGSAVAFGDQATLICGTAGAGKSTTAARLIAQGARFISDDLSVLHPDPAGGPPVLFAGRRAIRLFNSPALALGEAVEFLEEPHPAEGKLAVYPPQVAALQPVALARVIVLGLPAGLIPVTERAALLATQLFRPNRLCRMSGHLQRLAMLTLAARHLEVRGEPGL
jgi:hypothetical protein